MRWIFGRVFSGRSLETVNLNVRGAHGGLMEKDAQ